ncbi:peptidase S8 [Calothrix sp. HK-06]|nr:peptidase S8 [Calothrix sp. HK-06]
MKSHIRLILKEHAYFANAPHWQQLLQNKAQAVTNLHPEIDTFFTKYRLPVWVTQEYKPSGKDWNQEEIASGLNRVYRIILQQDVTVPDSLIQEMRKCKIVESVQLGAVGEAHLPTMQSAAMSMTTDMRSRQAIYLPEAHQFTQGTPEITVAVLDTGVSLHHPEFAHALLPGHDFVDIIDGAGKFLGDYLGADEIPEDEVGHGTHVAGIIAAQGESMPKGVVPNCKILPVRVLGAMQRGNKRVGAGLVDNINAGIKWAIDKGADVINMSLGIQHAGGGLPHQEVVDYAQRKGVSIIAASGNDGTEQLYYPGSLPYVIAVGATDEMGNIAPFSTYGKLDFVAPGTNIYSTYLNKEYAFSTGTSHASPFVAGAVALLKSYALKKKGIRLQDRQVKHLIQHTADKIDSRFKHRKAGFGRLNLIDALKLLDYKLNY